MPSNRILEMESELDNRYLFSVGIGRQSNPVFSIQRLFRSGRLKVVDRQNSPIFYISSQNWGGVVFSLHSFNKGERRKGLDRRKAYFIII